MSSFIPILAFGLLATLSDAALTPHAPLVLPRQSNSTISTTFANIKPSTKLDWVSCYDKNFQCTYLTVPLDYKDSKAGTTNVAFIRYLVSENAEDLLFNPGGPGASGVEVLQSFGPEFSKKWGYNAVSFDPRGVGWTEPKLSCGSSNSTRHSRRALPDLEEEWNTQLDSNKKCSAANKNTKAKYVGTSAVVQDMMQFTELQAAARGKDPKKAMINYYGISYGTLIGQTLAAMYPNRLRRVLLDANVYGVAHYQGWEPSGIDDLAHGIYLFNKYCYLAGEKWCALASGAKSIDEVKTRFDAVYLTLKKSPATYQGQNFSDVEFIALVQGYMYTPSLAGKGYHEIDNMTAGLMNRDFDPSAAKLIKRDSPIDLSQIALSIITQVDIAGRYPWTKYEQWKAQADKLETTAPYGAQGYATTNGIIGLGATIIPPESQLFPGFKPINTSAPVLFVNTLGDPVTPGSSARQMSRLFNRSGVLIIDGPGHGSNQAPSKCANEIIAKYMKDGVISTKETVCQTDVDPSFYFGAGPPAWMAS